MLISEKRALEIFTISIFHITAILVLCAFSLYVLFRAKKNPLLFSYLSVAAMLFIWMLSKLLKTVSPNETLRWSFVITQYFGVDFLSYCLLIFSYIYVKNITPTLKELALWAILPTMSFVIVMTNPLHMGFYEYFDFNRDSFGVLFYPVQAVHYAYLLICLIMLSRGFTSQPIFDGKRRFARFFAAIVLVPLAFNVYYILFKAKIFTWILPFPVFDFTPVAGTAALILFTVPALRFRFFDISPVTYRKLFESMPQGIVYMDRRKILYGGNASFYSMFNLKQKNISLAVFMENHLRAMEEKTADEFFDLSENNCTELKCIGGKFYKITKIAQKRRKALIYFTDSTELNANRAALLEQNDTLSRLNRKLDDMNEKMRQLAAAKTKAQMAQYIHDILGHSLTVVIGTAELAASESDAVSAKEKLMRVEELLTSSVCDLKNALVNGGADWKYTSLIKAVGHLKNENIEVVTTVRGDAYELNTDKTEAVFRLCQEAVTNSIKHGKAKKIYIILRYKPSELEIFAIDNGTGCKKIIKNYGLSGIEKRILDLSGSVEFTSDGESGFTIRAVIPAEVAKTIPRNS